jgi:hypothetical protein
MPVSSSAKPEPVPAISSEQPVVERGGLGSLTFLQTMQRWRGQFSGGNRIIPCDAAGTDMITLTPFDSSPLITGYRVYDRFTARAENTSTGPVTATVVPKRGELATLKVYKQDGAAQADVGDVVADCVYDFVYAEHLDGGAGGFILK